MFFGKEILGGFIDYLDYNDSETQKQPMENMKLLSNAPQSAIDAFENYKKIMEEVEKEDAE